MAIKLRVVASNMAELELNNGNLILFSYATPVAAYVRGRGYIVSSTSYSVTTSRHVHKWLGDVKTQTVDKSEIDNLLS